MLVKVSNVYILNFIDIFYLLGFYFNFEWIYVWQLNFYRS